MSDYMRIKSLELSLAYNLAKSFLADHVSG